MAAKKHTFSQIEKKVFMDILKTYSTLVENKNTDGSTLREQNVAWDSITREYNASPHVIAEVTNKQLRRLWMNLKQRQREALTKERQHHMATGGGPSTSDAVIDPDVAQIAPALMVEIPGAIDSDTVFLESADASMDLENNQPDLSLDITRQPRIVLISQPDHSPILSPTTPTPPTHPLSHTPMIHPPPPITTPPIITPPITTPPPPRTITRLPPPPTSSTSAASFQQRKLNILEKEYMDRLDQAGEIHALEKELLQYKIREAKAKAELAELILERERSREDTV